MRRTFCLIALTTGTLVAQTQPGLKPEDYCTLSGRVTSATTGEPVRKARVFLSPDTAPPYVPLTTTTDAAGNYAIKGIQPGRYRLTIERTGYLGYSYGARALNHLGSTLTLEKAQHMVGLELKLVPESAISGRVLDEDGDPIATAEVEAVRYSYRLDAGKQLTTIGNNHTDNRGSFRIYTLPPGKYYVKVTFRDSASTRGLDRSKVKAPTEAYAPTYYPGTFDPSTAATIEVTPGSEVQGIEIRLLKSRVSRVRGKVIGGDPAIYTNILLIRKDGSVLEAQGTDEKGSFELRRVSPGSHILRAEQTIREYRNFAQTSIEVGSNDIEGLTLTLSPSQTLKGVIRGGDTPVDFSEIEVYLRPSETPATRTPEGRGKGDGSFQLLSVVPGSYTVGMYPIPENHYVKSIRYGQEDALNKPLIVQQGIDATLEIVLQPGAARLTGIVKNEDKRPAQGAIVILEPLAENRRDLYKVATTDQNGAYNFTGIAPGDYRLYAFEDMEPGAYNDRDYLKDYEKQSEKLTLAARESKQYEATWIPAAKMQPR